MSAAARREIGRLIGAEMNDAVSPVERLEQISGMSQIGKPARAKFFPRRNSIEAENLISVPEQIANHKLTQPAAAAGNNDFSHFRHLPPKR